jgi:hypothetical protein
MKTYIKPSMRVYEILFPSHLLGDSTTKSGNTLQNDKGLVHKHTEEDIIQLSKEDMFSSFSNSASDSEWDK